MKHDISSKRDALVEGEAPAEPARAAGQVSTPPLSSPVTGTQSRDSVRAPVEGDPARRTTEPTRVAGHDSRGLPEGWHAPRKHLVHHVEPLKHHVTIAFVTVCTKDRSCWLVTPGVQALLREVWSDATAWMVGRYVIMPDHVHLFAGWVGDVPLKNWVQFWKSQFTKRHKVGAHSWQSGFWDTTMLSADQYAAKWEYVSENPVRHGFVVEAHEWPYTGELNKIDWS